MIFIRTIRIGVAFVLSVDICSHTRNTCCSHLLSGSYFGPLM